MDPGQSDDSVIVAMMEEPRFDKLSGFFNFLRHLR